MNHRKSLEASAISDTGHAPIVDPPRFFFPSATRYSDALGGLGPSNHLLERLANMLGDGESPRAKPQRDDDFDSATEVGFKLDLPPLGGRFKVLEKLGSGGMGEVYKAHDLETGREVAVKVPHHLGAQVDKRFDVEMNALATVVFPGTVGFVARGDANEPFLAMELVRGTSLVQTLMLGGALPAAVAFAVVRRVAAALASVHLSGWVHRDVKPGNIVLTDDGGVRLVDFGLARAIEGPGAGTQTGQILGTLGYLAPEQLGRDRIVNPNTDVYALGCLMFECLTGKRAWQRELSDVVIGLWSAERHPSLDVSGLPKAFGAVVSTLTDNDPALRPRDGLAALETILSADAAASASLAVPASARSAVRPTVEAALRGPVAVTGLARSGKSRVARAAALLVSETLAPAVVVAVHGNPHANEDGAHAAAIEQVLRGAGYRAAASAFRGERLEAAGSLDEPALVVVVDDIGFVDAKTVAWLTTLARSGLARVLATPRPAAAIPDGFTSIALDPPVEQRDPLASVSEHELWMLRLFASFGPTFDIAAAAPVAAHLGRPIDSALVAALERRRVLSAMGDSCYSFAGTSLWEEVMRRLPDPAPRELVKHFRLMRNALIGRVPVEASIFWRASASYG